MEEAAKSDLYNDYTPTSEFIYIKPRHLVKFIGVFVYVFAWWFGCGGLIALCEGWSFLEGIYFAFVSMTGIGYGDFIVQTVIGTEILWIFLFNAVAIILFFIQYLGRTFARQVAHKQIRLNRKRLRRRLLKRRLDINYISSAPQRVSYVKERSIDMDNASLNSYNVGKRELGVVRSETERDYFSRDRTRSEPLDITDDV